LPNDALLPDRLSGVDADPELQAGTLVPIVGPDRLLHRDRTPRRVERARKYRHHPVAQILDLLTPETFYLRAQQAEVLSAPAVGGIVAELLQELREADEIREQKGYDSYSQSLSSSPTVRGSLPSELRG
jgi:hypothetical protein